MTISSFCLLEDVTAQGKVINHAVSSTVYLRVSQNSLKNLFLASMPFYWLLSVLEYNNILYNPIENDLPILLWINSMLAYIPYKTLETGTI